MVRSFKRNTERSHHGTGVLQVRKVASGERGKNITALCVSAVGMFIPPLFVFPGKRMLNELMEPPTPPVRLVASTIAVQCI